MGKKLVPRARGKAWKDGARWRWTVWVTVGSDAIEEGIELGSPADALYASEAAAIHAMKKTVPEILTLACKAMGQGKPLDFIDLKEGSIVSVEEYTKPPFGKEEP